MAGATGLEPAASGVTGRRSNQLNYAPELLGNQARRQTLRTVDAASGLAQTVGSNATSNKFDASTGAKGAQSKPVFPHGEGIHPNWHSEQQV